MPDPNGLDVHDVVVKHAQAFDSQGKPANTTHVVFEVGSHGPFNLYYPSGDVTADKVNADIDKQVQFLRALTVRPA